MANEALYYGTGRRKNAVARVRLVPGTGKVTVNGRDAAEYFGRQALLDGALAPFKVTDTQGHFDVLARINGGGISGQAGALRHGIARALLLTGEDYRPILKKAGFLTRDPRMKERKKYGLKETPYRILMQENPALAMRVAVKGMLPKNTLGKAALGRVHIYAGAEHEHQAQKPIVLE